MSEVPQKRFQIKFIYIAIYCNTFFDIPIYCNAFCAAIPSPKLESLDSLGVIEVCLEVKHLVLKSYLRSSTHKCHILMLPMLSKATYRSL